MVWLNAFLALTIITRKRVLNRWGLWGFMAGHHKLCWKHQHAMPCVIVVIAYHKKVSCYCIYVLLHHYHSSTDQETVVKYTRVPESKSSKWRPISDNPWKTNFFFFFSSFTFPIKILDRPTYRLTVTSICKQPSRVARLMTGQTTALQTISYQDTPHFSTESFQNMIHSLSLLVF